jgi:hypothetical protein
MCSDKLLVISAAERQGLRYLEGEESRAAKTSALMDKIVSKVLPLKSHMVATNIRA